MDEFENLMPVNQNQNFVPTPKYATVYKIKFDREFCYIYVQYSEQFPSFEEFIGASKFMFCVDLLFFNLKIQFDTFVKLYSVSLF